MPEEPRYWGSWKGRVVRAIAIDNARTWTEIRDLTGLSPKSLNKVLAEMFDAKMLEKKGDEYRVAYELYKSYKEFFERGEIKEQPAKVSISEGEQKDLVGWIDDWRKVKRLDISLRPEHFFLEGRFLDDFSKEIMANSKREVLVVNPFVDKCDLSDTLRDGADRGVSVLLITRPPDESEKKEYHSTLIDADVKIYHNKSTHAKIIVVDRAVAIASSMNFYAASSGGKSWEAGLVSIEETVVESVVNSILSLTEMRDSIEMS